MPRSPSLFPTPIPPAAPDWEGLRVFSIGHSTLPLEEFVARLRAHGIATLVDVRSHPGSRRFPWFGKESLSESLPAAGIAYAHLPSLGGRRRPSALPPALNGAWRNDSFHAYADHMQTEEFRVGLRALRDLAAVAGPVAVLCAEALPWRCHRFLLSDALFARGVVVRHVTSVSAASDHVPPDFAVVEGGSVTYPAGA